MITTELLERAIGALQCLLDGTDRAEYSEFYKTLEELREALNRKRGVSFPLQYNGWTIHLKRGADFGCRGSVRKSRGYLCTRDGQDNIEVRPVSGNHGSLRMAKMLCDQRNELSDTLKKYAKE